MTGNLYIVATPIGNLKDLTIRAKETLESVDFIVCEDTRVTSKLLAGLGTRKTLLALHQHSADSRQSTIISRLEKGENAAYVSDAGTPGVNDPGGKLVAEALGQGIKVVPIPGPSALTAAISVCGFPMEHFTYLGFVPHKKGRQTFFKDIAEREEAVIFFESTHRLLKALESLVATLEPDRLVFVGRELTKIYETLYRGTSQEVLEAIKSSSVKGEEVIVIAPKNYHE
ncbi:MAG: 16S rRNA (cytidine(1402)-2'-O)-methyltransferase [Patescibacteria group bacterium]|nr:16S rRNA (cytidine(1402)-2'-O)-methyltransferase [Patescibacteria group bacterium]